MHYVSGMIDKNANHNHANELIMMTSSNRNIFRVTGPLCRNSLVTGEFPTQRPVTRSFDAFFDLSLNKRLSKQSWGWWFETPSCPLWQHCNDHDDDKKHHESDAYDDDDDGDDIVYDTFFMILFTNVKKIKFLINVNATRMVLL